jgi:hypothetical protein
MAVELKGRQFGAFGAALTSAFPSYAKLQLVTRIELDVRLQDIVAPGPLEQVAGELLTWAEAQGRVEDLLAGAMSQAPRNPKLLALAYELSLTSESPPGSRLESIIQPAVPMVNVAQWRADMDRRETGICRVEIPEGKPAGTGFLIGPDLILTNNHVAECMNSRGSSPANSVARFGFMTDSGGIATAAGDVFSFAGDWLVDRSPIAELDYAVIRLAATPGRPALAPPAPHAFTAGEINLILHHPTGSPLKLSAGTVTRFDAAKQRVTYTVNTEPGSSGSPVFTLDWKAVALHQRGVIESDKNNAGIPLYEIARRLTANNMWR